MVHIYFYLNENLLFTLSLVNHLNNNNATFTNYLHLLTAHSDTWKLSQFTEFIFDTQFVQFFCAILNIYSMPDPLKFAAEIEFQPQDIHRYHISGEKRQKAEQKDTKMYHGSLTHRSVWAIKCCACMCVWHTVMQRSANE